ncbi:hypothetical protein ACIP93_35265 [Streptomyces sp. NPDC088745]|uniref:hypothetical protein n=1 Tax=Streptomyces sp. NPDC088745 TaxID=3365884 RepID=UPI003806699D
MRLSAAAGLAFAAALFTLAAPAAPASSAAPATAPAGGEPDVTHSVSAAPEARPDDLGWGR